MALEGGGGGGSSRGVRAGAAYIELNGKDNTQGFFGRMKQRFMGAMKALGAIAVAGLGVGLAAIPLVINPLLDTITDLRKMDDVAKAFGTTGKAASGLFGVLGAAGGEFKENLEGVIQFSQTVTDAVNGVGEKGAQLFDGLAVTAKDISKLPIDEQFYQVLGAIRQIPQPLQEAKLALLGGTDSMKQWQQLLSMSEDDIRSLADKLSFSNTELKAAAEAGRAYQKATQAVGRAWQQVAVAVAPTVQRISEWAGQAAESFTEWIKGRSIENLIAEGGVRLKQGLQEAIMYARDLLSGLWDYFTKDSDKLGSVLWDLVKSLVKYVISSLATAIPIVTRGFQEIVKNMLMASAAFKKSIGDNAGAEDDIKAAVLMNSDLMKNALKDAQKADDAEFASARDALAGEAQKLWQRVEQSRKNNEKADAEDRAELQKQLDPILEAAERMRGAAVFQEFMDLLHTAPTEQVFGKDMATVGKALGTFGGDSFLTQGFGVQGAEDVNKKLDKGNKLAAEGNEHLAEIKKKVGPQKFQ